MEFKKIEDLKDKFLSLPDETQREYEKEIVSIGLSSRIENFTAWVHKIKDLNDDKITLKDALNLAEKGNDLLFDNWLDELMGDENEDFSNPKDERIGFAAFATKMEKYRRNQDFTNEYDLLKRYTRKFKNGHPFFNHLNLLCLQSLSNRPSDLTMLELANKNKEAMPNNSGAVHLFAFIVAEILEEPVLDEAINRSEWYEKGMSAAQQAVSLDPTYAKFYATRGRLFALGDKYSDALKDLKTAIDLEDSSKEDYALRIDYYRGIVQEISQRQRSQVVVNELKAEVKSVESEIKKESHNNLVKNMEFLGLFAGIVSFTIGGISIAVTGFSGRDAASLIIILMGALMGVFSTFGTILHGFKKPQGLRNLIVFIGALVIIGIGLLILLVK